MNTLCGGLFNAAMGGGQTLGPLVSSLLYDKVGFRWTQDVVALTCIVFAIAYFVFGRGKPRSSKKDKLLDEYKKLEYKTRGNDGEEKEKLKETE